MDNLDIKIKGNIMTITVDLSHEIGVSGSGKSTSIATTGGRKEIPGAEDKMIMCNIFKLLPQDDLPPAPPEPPAANPGKGKGKKK